MSYSNILDLFQAVNTAIALLFVLCYAYQAAYLFVPFLLSERKEEKRKKEVPFHRFAVLVSARNEERVIAHLIDSVKKQDYPADKLEIFVVADNCTDRTAAAAREAGANVYERHDEIHVGKGYALDFLLERIRRERGEDAFDGYFVFDADNLLAPDYVREMNRTFSAGYEVVTSYRNSKNYGDNWISAGYALWFLREAEYLNHARALLGGSCAVSGCGFLFGGQVLRQCGGWKFYLLTEDLEFTMKNVLDGRKIGYCRDAVFYDEQPVRFAQSWHQRMRWAKGYWQVLHRYGLDLVRGILGGGPEKGKKESHARRFCHRFTCFDMVMSNVPAFVLSFFSVLVNLAFFLTCCFIGKGLGTALLSAARSLAGTYGSLFLLGALTTTTEWKRIHTTAVKKLCYTFTFPIFMATYLPIAFVSLFTKVCWVPIEHTKALTIVDIGKE